jgi:positive phototaxis protein PixI
MTTETPTPTTEHFLRFLLPPSTHAMISTDQVMEILNLNPRQIVSIPDVASTVMGVLNWRGEVLWLVDLGYLLGTTPLFQQQSKKENYRALVIQHSMGYLGLVVNRVSQSFWCDPNTIQLLSKNQRSTKLDKCLKGYWTNPAGETIWVLDCEAVIGTLSYPSG